jgi:hypothetical protein
MTFTSTKDSTIVDADALAAALAGRPALEREHDGTYTWFEEMGRGPAAPPAGRPACDFTRMWAGLGLEQPGAPTA